MTEQSEAPGSSFGPAGPQPSVLVSNRQSRPVDLENLAGLAARTLSAEGRPSAELSLSLVEEKEMADLHVRFMHEEGPTDVLSFPMDDEGLLGDVVVCPSQAQLNNPGDPAGELRLLVVHGILHLLGYDHQRERERSVMWAKQDVYVSERREAQG